MMTGAPVSVRGRLGAGTLSSGAPGHFGIDDLDSIERQDSTKGGRGKIQVHALCRDGS